MDNNSDNIHIINNSDNALINNPNNKIEKVLDFITYELRDEINSIKNDDRNIRKRSLNSFKRKIVSKHKEFTEDEYKCLINDTYKPLLKLFSDNADNCRELAVTIITTYFLNASTIDDQLTYVIPVLVQRLGGTEIVETSEEIRLLEVQLISMIIDKCGDKVLAYMNDIINILSRTIIDPYPEVKKESCHSAGILAITLKKHFHLQSEKLVAPLLNTLSHQHSKVRCSGLKALKLVALHGDNKCVSDIIPHLAQRLFDSAPTVRREVTQLVGEWLYQLPDRYSFFSKLIPLLLSSMDDEIQEIVKLTQELWIKAGNLYLEENEESYKDQIDFESNILYPEGVPRPSCGCRILVQKHIYYILPALINDLNDWSDDTRFKAAQLLIPLVVHCEAKIAAYTDRLLPALCKATGDECQKVVALIKQAARYFGVFVDMPTWIPILLPLFNISPHPGNLRVLACLLPGAFDLSEANVAELCNKLMVLCQESAQLEGVQACVEALLEKPAVPGYPLFYVAMALQAREMADGLLDRLARYLGMDSPADLYRRYAGQLLEALREDLPLWTVNSPNLYAYLALLRALSSCDDLSLELAFDMLQQLLETSADPKLKLRVLTVLSAVLPQFQKGQEVEAPVVADCVARVVHAMLLPCLEWHAGRSASALRSAAILCLWTTLTSSPDTPGLWHDGAQDKMVTLLTGVLDDDQALTRKTAVRLLTHLLQHAPALDTSLLGNLYPEVMKRLDDPTNDVRLSAASFFIAYFKNFPGGYDIRHYRLHYEDICQGLLVHLDDPDPAFQHDMLGVLKHVATVCPKALLDLVDEVRHKHRTPYFCDLLKEYLAKQLAGSH